MFVISTSEQLCRISPLEGRVYRLEPYIGTRRRLFMDAMTARGGNEAVSWHGCSAAVGTTGSSKSAAMDVAKQRRVVVLNTTRCPAQVR
jgi:hypothetical protein